MKKTYKLIIWPDLGLCFVWPELYYFTRRKRYDKVIRKTRLLGDSNAILAVDRQNERLDDFYNPHHKAILKMIQMVVENAHMAGKWAGICGELGADQKFEI